MVETEQNLQDLYGASNLAMTTLFVILRLSKDRVGLWDSVSNYPSDLYVIKFFLSIKMAKYLDLSLPMKLYVSPGPKQTKRTCWILDLERLPYIVTWPVKGLMHAEEVDGRWSWRSMAQRCLKINVFTSSLVCYHLISILQTKLQCKSRGKLKGKTGNLVRLGLKIVGSMMYQLTVSSNRQSMSRITWDWHNKDLQSSLLFFVLSENLSLQF